MILIFGTYRCAERRVAYRKDWCRTCDAECHAEQLRAFGIGHLYGIPLLPLGFRRRWRCTACANDPRVRTVESPGMLVIGIVVFSLLFLLMLWPIIPTHDAGTIWGARAVFLVLIATCALLLRTRLPEPAAQRHVTPYAGTHCHYCSGALVDRDGPYCPRCRVHELQDLGAA